LGAKKLTAAVVAVGIAAGGVVATQAANGASSLRISAANGLKFNKKTMKATHGKVTIRMANPTSLPHAIAVEGHGVDKDGKTVQKGGTSTVSLRLKKGRYTFYCPVDGHRAAGMKGTLIVS